MSDVPDAPPAGGPDGRPDPSAESLEEFVRGLEQLRVNSGLTYKEVERKSRQKKVPRQLPDSTVQPVLKGQRPLSRIRNPELFVESLVMVCGSDPQRWVAECRRLLGLEYADGAQRADQRPAESTHREAAGRWRAPRRLAARSVLVVGTAVVFFAVVMLITVRAGLESPVATTPLGGVDYTRPAVIRPVDSDELRLAIESATDLPGAAAIIVAPDSSEIGVWEFAAPHQQNSSFWQFRVAGAGPACLEVPRFNVGNDVRIQRWTCNGGQNQYWKAEPRADHYWIVNLNSGKCASVSGDGPLAGMPVVQRTCDGRASSQRWAFSPSRLSQPFSTR